MTLERSADRDKTTLIHRFNTVMQDNDYSISFGMYSIIILVAISFSLPDIFSLLLALYVCSLAELKDFTSTCTFMLPYGNCNV